jgi:hypothetical protein
MTKADQFRQYAEEATRWAFRSKTEKEKEAYIDLALTWTQAPDPGATHQRVRSSSLPDKYLRGTILNIATVLAFAIVSFVAAVPAHADSCGSVIAGASTGAYQGRYGGYDYDGNCHSRDVSSDSECRRLTGSLYLRFARDSGKGFNHCAFRQPASSQGAKQQQTPQPQSRCRPGYSLCQSGGCVPIGSVCCEGDGYCDAGYMCTKTGCLSLSSKRACPDGGYCNNPGYECDRTSRCFDPNARAAEQAAEEQRQKEDIETARKDCTSAYNRFMASDVNTQNGRMLLDMGPSFMREACLKAGMSDLVRNADKRRDELLRKAEQKGEPEKKSVPQVCTGPRYTETAWCASDKAPRSSQVHCIDGPVQTGDTNLNTGDKNYSIGLSLSCSAEYYMAVVESHHADGTCTREVVTLSPKNRTRGNVPGDSGWANVTSVEKPVLLDAIVAAPISGEGKSMTELRACYTRRHQGGPCSCDTSSK